MTILFVDDDESILAMYEEQCEEAGMENHVLFCCTSNTAMEIIAHNRCIGHVICDGKIPSAYGKFPNKKQGLRVLEYAKKNGIEERWIVSGDIEVQREACAEGLATRAAAKIDAVKKVKEELL